MQLNNNLGDYLVLISAQSGAKISKGDQVDQGPFSLSFLYLQRWRFAALLAVLHFTTLAVNSFSFVLPEFPWLQLALVYSKCVLVEEVFRSNVFKYLVDATST